METGPTIQFSAQQLYYYLGGFTKDIPDSEVILSETPALGVQGIVPADSYFSFSSYDQPVVNGVTYPANVDEQSIYMGDFDQINIYGYEPRENQWGIVVSFVDAITSAGADLTWVQLACCDSSGVALTYAATGEPIHTPPLNQFTTFLFAASAGDVDFTATDAASFIDADFLWLNIGQPNQEIVRLDTHGLLTMNITTPLNYDHDVGETIFAAFREFKGKQTVPEGYTGGQAANYWNIYVSAIATQVRRF